MLNKKAMVFFRSLKCFHSLDEATLQAIVRQMSLESYPSGARISTPDAPAIFIVKEGSLKVSSGSDAALITYAAGEVICLDELASNVRIETIGETSCYVARSKAAADIIKTHPQVATCHAEATRPDSTHALETMTSWGSERALFTLTLKDVLRPSLLGIPASEPISQAARLMSAHGAQMLVALADDGSPLGIVTDRALRQRAIAMDKPPSTPITEVMEAGFERALASDFCYEALIKINSTGADYLLVMEGGRPIGSVGIKDLLALQWASPLMLAGEIEVQRSIEGLARISAKTQALIGLLLKEGARAGSILRVITEINDRIEHKVLSLALKELGPPPLPFCWAVYGSAGRKEQTFKTDQDNAIIYADPVDEAQSKEAARYFKALADKVVQGLYDCGFSYCTGNYMANNPDWCKPLSAWKGYFTQWVRTPDSEALIRSVIIFDLRGIYGDLALSQELKRHLQQELKGATLFLHALAGLTTNYHPPIGVFGNLNVEQEGDHVNQLNLKNGCITPLINIVRLCAFEAGLAETSTSERIEALKATHPLIKTHGNDLLHAFENISSLRVRHQYEQSMANVSPDNYINPSRLNALELNSLKGICRMLVHILKEIEKKYSFESGL